MERFSRESPERFYPLTQRERLVLSLMGQGLTNAEIAASLHLAQGTVKAHTSSIFRKLGARNRTEAVLISLGHLSAS